MIDYEMTFNDLLDSAYYSHYIEESYKYDSSAHDMAFNDYARMIWDNWDMVIDDLARQCEDYQINVNPLWHRVACDQSFAGSYLERVLLFAEETFSLDSMIFAIQDAWDYDAGRLAYVPDGLDDFSFDYDCTEQELERAVCAAYAEEQDAINEWLRETADYYGLRQAF